MGVYSSPRYTQLLQNCLRVSWPFSVSDCRVATRNGVALSAVTQAELVVRIGDTGGARHDGTVLRSIVFGALDGWRWRGKIQTSSERVTVEDVLYRAYTVRRTIGLLDARRRVLGMRGRLDKIQTTNK